MAIPKKRDKHRKKRIVLVIAAVVVCIAAGFCLIGYQKIRKSKNAAIGISDSKHTSGAAFGDDAHTISYNDKKYRYNDHLSNFVFMGIDNRDSHQTKTGNADAGQADAVFVMSWDRVEHTFKLVSIPRDTMTEIEIFGFNGKSLGKSKDHLSLAYAFGDGRNKSCELVRDAVSNLLYDIPLQGYCSINMEGIAIITEEIGGVAVTVPDDSLSRVYPEFQEGAEVLLTKDNVETFVRYRDITQDNSALKRQKRQSVFLNAYGAKALEVMKEDPALVTRLYNKLQNYMVTNMGNDLFLKISDDVLTGGTRENFTVPGEGVKGKSFDEYHVDQDALYDMVLRVFYEEVA